MQLTFLTPMMVSLVLSVLPVARGEVDHKAGIYKYPKAFSLMLMFCAGAMLTIPLWPNVGLSEMDVIFIESFFGVFFLIGVGLKFYRVIINDTGISSGIWRIDSVIQFSEVSSIESFHRIKASYLLLTMKNAKKYKIEGSIDNFDDLCNEVIKRGKENGVKNIVVH